MKTYRLPDVICFYDVVNQFNTEHVIIAHRMTQAVRLVVTYIYEWQVSRDNRGIRFESIVEQRRERGGTHAPNKLCRF